MIHLVVMRQHLLVILVPFLRIPVVVAVQVRLIQVVIQAVHQMEVVVMETQIRQMTTRQQQMET